MSQVDTTTTPGSQESPEALEAAAAAATTAADAAAAGASTEPKTFSAEYVADLRREAAKFRTDAKAAADKLKEREDAELSESEKAKKDAKDAQERADKAERELLRTQVATKKKLSPELAARLVGDTKEALEKDADKLIRDLGGTGAGAGGGFDQGAGRGSAAKRSPMDAAIRGAFARGRSSSE
jgi:hypothetical protein